MDITNNKVDLDRPFGAPVQDIVPVGTQKPEEKKEEQKVEPTEPARVPYSRLENVVKARREAEAEAEKWRARALELEESRFTSKPADAATVPAEWIAAYGDNEQSRQAYAIHKRDIEAVEARAEERALSKIAEREKEGQEAYKENLISVDEHLDLVAAVAGHELTEDESSKILDIVDEYTAKDDEGNYAGALLPPDKAWEIYELKNSASTAGTRNARNGVANVISAPSQGQPSADQVERDKRWTPWPNWEDRLK